MVDPRLLEMLACPVDRSSLRCEAETLRCVNGHEFPVVQGIPVLLADVSDPTHPYLARTLEAVRNRDVDPVSTPGDAVDAFVQDEIVKTNGNLYRHLLGRLPRYPIPEIRLPAGAGRSLLDVGANWGRWSLAAARRGWRSVALEPWIDAALAGTRVARQLGLDVRYVVGDARHLPFRDGSVDASFSYSVLQHFKKDAARTSISEMSRVTREGGTVLVQLPNIFGLRQFANLVRQRISNDQNPFRVRYWTPREIRTTFERLVGPTKLSVDGFFSLNPQATDLDLMPPRYAAVVRASEALRAVSRTLPPVGWVADSLYAEARRGSHPTP